MNLLVKRNKRVEIKESQNLFVCRNYIIYNIILIIFFVLFSFEENGITLAQSTKTGKVSKSAGSHLSSAPQNPKTNVKEKIKQSTDSKIFQQQHSVLQPQAPAITLQADRDHVQIYEEVKFSLEPAAGIINSSYQFTFTIDNNIKIVKGKSVNFIIYRFSNTGKHNISVSVSNTSPQMMALIVKPPVINSISVQVDSIMFEAIPPELQAGQSVLLITNFQSDRNDIRCRFFLGDSNSFSEWSPGFTLKHVCSKPGAYSFFAEIRVQGGNFIRGFTRSIIRKIVVEPQPLNNPQTTAVILNADKKRVYTGKIFDSA